MLPSTVRLHPSPNFIWRTDALRMCWAGSQARKADLFKKFLGFHGLSHILRTWPGPLKKNQVHSRIQTQLPPLYLSSASDRTISTDSCHSLLSPWALEDRPQHHPTPMTWKGSVSGVWHAHVSDPYSVVLVWWWWCFFVFFFLITTQFSKPED